MKDKPAFKLVEFLQPYTLAGERLYEVGERAEMRDWIADKMAARGIVILIVEPMEPVA